jgi:2-polyprenyl-6-methoxyphenol hydroxylase-like FAD-dependent oxidoreductase
VATVQVSRVLVVGGGIGGLGAAAAFAQRGVGVDVVEVRTDAAVHGVGINQPANSLRMLRSLGVLDEIREVGYEHARTTFRDWQGSPIVDCPSQLGGDVPANVALSRRELHRILITAGEQAGAKITYDTSVEDLQDDGTEVHVTLTDGRSAGYDLVVAFDGLRSPMRRRLFGTEFEPVFSGYSVWRVALPRPDEVTHLLLFQGDRSKAGLIPLSESSMYLFLVTPEVDKQHVAPDRMTTMLTERLAGYGGLIGELRDALDPSAAVVYSPLSEVMLPSPWYQGRTIVLGDAAHACAPHLTQGAGMALEDAVGLAEELDTETRSVAASLKALMHRRYARVKFVQDVSHQILATEMAVTARNLPQAREQMQQTLPGQIRQVESFLNSPF